MVVRLSIFNSSQGGLLGEGDLTKAKGKGLPCRETPAGYRPAVAYTHCRREGWGSSSQRLAVSYHMCSLAPATVLYWTPDTLEARGAVCVCASMYCGVLRFLPVSQDQPHHDSKQP